MAANYSGKICRYSFKRQQKPFGDLTPPRPNRRTDSISAD